MNPTHLDLDALRATPLATQPFEFLIVPHFVRADMFARINADYPAINRVGSFPAEQLSYGTAFREFLEELETEEFRKVFEDKFQIDLTGRPTGAAVRGRCGSQDGQIHTDAKSKLLTLLIYMNPSWEQPGGRLRLLRSDRDLDDVIVEVPPAEGTLLAFKRADNSWHGHKPFEGERRVIQFNWYTSEGNRRLTTMLYRVSAPLRRMFASHQSPQM